MPRKSVPGSKAPRDTGFSLMEIVVAMGIFSVLAVAAATLSIDALGTAGDNRERVRAANLAAEEVERVRAKFNVARGSVAGDCLTRDATVNFGDGVYTLDCASTWLDDNRAPGPAGSPITAATGSILRVKVTVTWPHMDGVKPVINTTLLA